MAMNHNVRDREFYKFEETTEGETSVRVTIANASEICAGNKGETASAGESISAVKVIYSNGVSVFLGDANTNFQEASAIGVAITSATTGNEVRYLIDGSLYDSSFSFTDGEPVFLALNGGLTQTNPDTLGYKYRVLIGVANGSNGLFINIQEPIEL